ncbi:MAG: family 78 glycoside hydrolase catalytic domain, partial [Eubacteriales bacterium]|nr:family 78 glycoside hydrolase catalytic domain [Eubacteriales bacterium]
MNLSKLKTNHMANPLGIDMNPYFSWIIESTEQNVIQTAYQIIVKNQDGNTFWDTGKVLSDTSSFVEYGGNQFVSRSKYTWTVTVWDNHKNSATASAYFETALLHKSDWNAKWVDSELPQKKRKYGIGKQASATMFRKKFALEKDIESARLYATCHGIYRLTINGIRPDDREFAPENTSYEKYLCYQTYDVTRFLKKGENALGMHVGDGWYCCPQTTMSNKIKPVHGILFQLEILYSDGTKDTVISDGDVKTSHGAVLSSDIFAGEFYDSNLEIDGWDKGNFSDNNWKNAVIRNYGYDNLVAQHGQPVRPILEIPAAKAYVSSKGENIIDFGQIIAGRIRMKVALPKDKIITIDHFETPDKEGNFFNNILANKLIGIGIGADQKIVFTSNGKAAVYSPFFTFHGFRYIRISGMENIQKEDFTAIVLSSEMDNTGSFECSNELINRLYENTRWSQRSNMLSIPTDCPQREKAGWTGDISIYAATSLLNEDTTPFLTRFLENLCCDQFENGGVPVVI